jgi:hypothetical protein
MRKPTKQILSVAVIVLLVSMSVVNAGVLDCCLVECAPEPAPQAPTSCCQHEAPAEQPAPTPCNGSGSDDCPAGCCVFTPDSATYTVPLNVIDVQQFKIVATVLTGILFEIEQFTRPSVSKCTDPPPLIKGALYLQHQVLLR